MMEKKKPANTNPYANNLLLVMHGIVSSFRARSICCGKDQFQVVFDVHFNRISGAFNFSARIVWPFEQFSTIAQEEKKKHSQKY